MLNNISLTGSKGLELVYQKVNEFVELEYGSSMNFIQGQILYYEGLRPLGIFLIRKGKVKILKEFPLGKDKTVSILKSNQLLGVRDYLNGNFYTNTAVAIEDSEIFFIEAAKIQRLLEVYEFKSLLSKLNG